MFVLLGKKRGAFMTKLNCLQNLSAQLISKFCSFSPMHCKFPFLFLSKLFERFILKIYQ